ncbi:hypothetical protein [Hymenobacter antarcticus]|uniref:Uncharacterized protein n=1 Tax=Hymenobacter antarcticus TaxID=486270 RepID=A0ABP7QRI3_9BACT
MITPTELQIEQRDGSIEKFSIAHANEYLQQYRDEFPPGEHEYRVYKRKPITGFSIVVQEKENALFITHVSCDSLDCKRKNIVVEALRFISDQHRVPIFSSLKEGYYDNNELDRLVPDTMGKRWEKMLESYPDRVKFWEDLGRYVFLPKQA